MNWSQEEEGEIELRGRLRRFDRTSAMARASLTDGESTRDELVLLWCAREASISGGFLCVPFWEREIVAGRRDETEMFGLEWNCGSTELETGVE